MTNLDKQKVADRLAAGDLATGDFVRLQESLERTQAALTVCHTVLRSIAVAAEQTAERIEAESIRDLPLAQRVRAISALAAAVVFVQEPPGHA